MGTDRKLGENFFWDVSLPTMLLVIRLNHESGFPSELGITVPTCKDPQDIEIKTTMIKKTIEDFFNLGPSF